MFSLTVSLTKSCWHCNIVETPSVASVKIKVTPRFRQTQGPYQICNPYQDHNAKLVIKNIIEE